MGFVFHIIGPKFKFHFTRSFQLVWELLWTIARRLFSVFVCPRPMSAPFGFNKFTSCFAMLAEQIGRRVGNLTVWFKSATQISSQNRTNET